MVKFLLNNDGNANHREPSVGNTALMMAAAEGHEIIVQNLLQYGIEIEAKNYNGDTARSLALLNGHMKIVSLIDNQTLPLTLLRAEPGLHVDEDLSSSDEYYRRPTRPPTKSQRCRSKHANNTGPSIRDAPEAMARLLNESRSKAITDNKLAFSNSLWLEKYGGGDEEPFCVSGAVTIKSASSSCSSSTGGLAAVLGLQQLSVDSADDAAAPSIERESTAMDTTSDDMVMHAKYCEEKKQTQLYDKSDNIESSHSVDGEQTSVQTSQQIVKCEVNDATNQNKPLVTTENQNKPLVTSSNQNKSLVTSTNQNKPLVTTANQNKPVLSTANTLQETASGGNPLEGINLDAYCENFNLPGKNKGQTLHYKDLSELLESLNLSKYHRVFDEQDVDLRLFLTLTDMDLKEVGI
ncbi:uncharacterized protein LOC102806883, partial [Saccoglossus kowalevskii]|uniref:Ankyrin repeat and SAM domain-containing protein 3-like n=1 Tax=Saccoglossus kowalevskii TaxID=10224 RepID=A0ABM0MUJ8_SACKO